MAQKNDPRIAEVLLALLPPDGAPIGNAALREELAEELGREVEEYEYIALRDALIAQDVLVKGKGRGGSVRLGQPTAADFDLQGQRVRDAEPAADKKVTKPAAKGRAGAKTATDPHVISYRHADKRRNNPEVGMVDPDSDPDEGRTRYAYDPHLDPALRFDVSRAEVERIIDDALGTGDEAAMREALLTLKRIAEPYLNWTGKAERTSFEIDTVSLHVHERIDPATILGAVQKRLKQGKDGADTQQDWLRAWFETPLPYREAIEFYKHDRGWSNRLIAGDSLLVMNSLLQKEGMAGQVQMIYIDPPYGIKYGSNFQPFVNKRDVKDRKDEDLTQEPEMIKAFRDTWELGIHSYLAYLRDRLLLARELLSESGSVFVQISDENVHRVRSVLDEVFGRDNAFPTIVFRKTTGAGSPSGYVESLPQTYDLLLWYGRKATQARLNRLYLPKSFEDDPNFNSLQDRIGRRRSITRVGEIGNRQPDERLYRQNPLTSQSGGPTTQFPVRFKGNRFEPKRGGWKTNSNGVRRIERSCRLLASGETLGFQRFSEDFACQPVIDIWDDTIDTYVSV